MFFFSFRSQPTASPDTDSVSSEIGHQEGTSKQNKVANEAEASPKYTLIEIEQQKLGLDKQRLNVEEACLEVDGENGHWEKMMPTRS